MLTGMQFGLCAVVALSACYAPFLPSGVPCDPSRDNCPVGQTCQADGSGSFCRGADGSTTDAGRGDAEVADTAPSHIVYVGPFVQHNAGTGANDSFTAQAHATGNAVMIQVSCAASAVPTAVSVSAPGWLFTQLGPITASASSSQRSATVVTIAPDTVGTTVAVSWTGSNCDSSKNEVGDEFAMVDSGGGTITIDGSNATEGSGDCVGTVTTGHATDAVWAACNSENRVTAVGVGFTKGADDTAGDWSEYAITNDPADTIETVRFANGTAGYVLSMVTLKPR